MIGALLKVLSRCKWFYSVIVGTLALLALLLIPRVSAFAEDLPSGNGTTTATGQGFTVGAQTLSVTSGGDGEQLVVTSGDAYRGFILWEGTYYLTYYWKLSSGSDMQYHTGNLYFQDTIDATYSTSTGWTVDRTGYTMAIVDSTEGFHVGMSSSSSSDVYHFHISYEDLYANANNYYSFTVAVHFSGRSVRSTGDYNLPYPPNVKVKHGLSIVSTSFDVGSGDSLLSQEINDALEDNLTLASMEAKLGYIHNDLTSMLAQDASNYSGLMSALNNYNTGYVQEGTTIVPKTTGQLLAILVDCFRSNNATVTQSQADINSAHNKEAQLETGFSGILQGLNNGSVDFDDGIVQINAVNPSGFIEQHAQAFEFWRTVGNKALTRDTSTGWGAVAGFLMIVVLLAFTAWVLHL